MSPADFARLTGEERAIAQAHPSTILTAPEGARIGVGELFTRLSLARAVVEAARVYETHETTMASTPDDLVGLRAALLAHDAEAGR